MILRASGAVRSGPPPPRKPGNRFQRRSWRGRALFQVDRKTVENSRRRPRLAALESKRPVENSRLHCDENWLEYRQRVFELERPLKTPADVMFWIPERGPRKGVRAEAPNLAAAAAGSCSGTPLYSERR
eukprot:767678-Hanusia_phi.AAC.2